MRLLLLGRSGLGSRGFDRLQTEPDAGADGRIHGKAFRGVLAGQFREGPQRGSGGENRRHPEGLKTQHVGAAAEGLEPRVDVVSAALGHTAHALDLVSGVESGAAAGLDGLDAGFLDCVSHEVVLDQSSTVGHLRPANRPLIYIHFRQFQKVRQTGTNGPHKSPDAGEGDSDPFRSKPSLLRYPIPPAMSGRRLPPTPKKFEQNDLYKFKRGFASKVPAEMARTRFNLNPGKEDIVWLSPDGKSIMSDRQANLHNSRRRSALNTSDAWRDLKKIEPEKAKEIGWNNFQKLLRNIKGSRVQVLKRLEKVGIDIDTIDELARASDGEIGDNTGWGDSG